MSWRAEGGVTLSGGEPLAQPDFAAELLQRFREEGVGTALETCGYVPFEAFQKAAPFCQLIFFDLKCMASEVHRRYTGVDNRRILDNLMALSREFPDLPLQVRTPLIPGVNDGWNSCPKSCSSCGGSHRWPTTSCSPITTGGRESTANWAGAIHWPDWSRRTGGR